MKIVTKRFFFSILLLACLSKLAAENCSDCPLNHEGKQHHELIKSSDFHCDQIRKLRAQVDELEKIVKKQSQLIQSLEEEIKDLDDRC